MTIAHFNPAAKFSTQIRTEISSNKTTKQLPSKQDSTPFFLAESHIQRKDDLIHYDFWVLQLLHFESATVLNCKSTNCITDSKQTVPQSFDAIGHS